ncbi:hypothetical protein P5673_014452 [Acropora cervicornis]|uniref:Uncharacterized protein n=1 Tax=Acropora cervicornis TaxID=6130 RepID=A0AAD9QKQ4_ACRCE|nr:hypothetical protein P5673_014452 [Acropora cervicornis]
MHELQGTSLHDEARKQLEVTVASLLKTVKTEQSFITEAFLCSDNGACYHNVPLLFALPAIGSRTGIQIKQYDVSEPQAGKDISNKKIAPMKAHIRHVNERHVVTAAEMKEALESHGGITGCRAAVAKINTANETGETNKLKGISKLNNFEFTEAGIRVWCAYQIGPGSLVTYVGKTAQGETGMKSLQPFGTSPQGHIHTSRKNQEMKFCADFQKRERSSDHMDTGTHQLVLERETVYDTIRRKWAQHVTGIVSRSAECSRAANPPDTNLSSCSDNYLSLLGWALKGQKNFDKNL